MSTDGSFDRHGREEGPRVLLFDHLAFLLEKGEAAHPSTLGLPLWLSW